MSNLLVDFLSQAFSAAAIVILIAVPLKETGHEIHSEGENVKKILTFFYPDNPPSKITSELKDLVQKMVKDAVVKSGWLNKVPRPSGWKPGMGYLIKSGYRVIQSGQDEGIYEAIQVKLALNFKSEYTLMLINAEIN